MTAPDTIYVQVPYWTGYGTRHTGPWEDKIVYDRRKSCVWRLDDAEQSIWVTSCGHTFRFPGGDGPMENMFGWCPYCGGEIQEEQDD